MDGLPVIKRIVGREDDWVKLKNGTRISFHPFYQVMERRPMVKQFRFVQKKNFNIEAFIVLKNGIDRERFKKDLIEDLQTEISDLLVYKVIFAPKLRPDPTGKLRMLISEIFEAEKAG